jgi:adenylate cyclase
LANILPASIAERLKNPAHGIIADKYDDASILFADIAGYTKRASDTTPTELVRFLDALYTDLDGLVDRHGLEKIKTSGDSYMVVSGVPEPRVDHLQALASLALDMADAVADLKDPQGREVPLRIGLATGPVVAGVVAHASSSMTSGVTQSTWPPYGGPRTSRAAFKWPTSIVASPPSSASRNVAR